MKMYAPIRFEMQFGFAIDDFVEDEGAGTRMGWATATMGRPGRLPTWEQVQASIQECLEAIEAAGGRQMTKAEFFNELMAERTGFDMEWATPGGKAWEDGPDDMSVDYDEDDQTMVAAKEEVNDLED